MRNPETTTSDAAFDQEIEKLFEVHFASLFRYLQRLTGDADLAADLAQETFVRLYTRGSVPDDPRGWLAAVANNLLRDEQRRTKRRRALLVKRPHDIAQLDHEEETPELRVLRQEQRTGVRTALAALPERDQQILLLRHEGFSYREIAAAVSVAESGVGTLLVRAMRAFRVQVMSKSSGGVHASQ